MKTSMLKRDENRVEFEVSLEEDEFDNLYNRALSKIGRGVKIPGFRPGRAPISLIKGLIDEERILDEIKDEISKKAVREIVEKEKKIFPSLETTIKDFSRENPRFTITVYKIPEFKSIDLESIIEKIKDVSDDEIDKKIEELRNEFKEYIPKEDGEVKEGDYVVLSYGLKDEDKRETASLVVGEGKNIFEGHAIGMKLNEEKIVKINEAEYKIKILEIKYPKLPELNEDFFKDFGVDDETSFREKVKEMIINERLSEERIEDFISEELLNVNKFYIPKEYIEEETENKFENLRRELLRSGIKISDFLKIRGQSKEEIKESLSRSAEKEIKYNLILDFLSQGEEVSDDEIKEYYGDEWEEVFSDKERKDNAALYIKKRKFLNKLIEKIRERIKAGEEDSSKETKEKNLT